MFMDRYRRRGRERERERERTATAAVDDKFPVWRISHTRTRVYYIIRNILICPADYDFSGSLQIVYAPYYIYIIYNNPYECYYTVQNCAQLYIYDVYTRHPFPARQCAAKSANIYYIYIHAVVCVYIYIYR